MIYNFLVTGDCHGRFERIGKIDTIKYSPNETALIILGDAGFNFYLNSTDNKLKKSINATGFTIYCVRGNHEQRPELVKGMEIIWDNDINNYVYYQSEFPKIRYLFDGGIYRFGDYRALVIGGAYSVDKWYRLNSAKIKPDSTEEEIVKKAGWFPTEQLTEKEITDIESTVLITNSFDFVFSHTCPYSWMPVDLFLSGLSQSSVDNSMEFWMEKFKDTFKWKIWLFGHFHDDRLIRPKVEMYYRDIEDIRDIVKRWESPENLDWWLKKDPNYYLT